MFGEKSITLAVWSDRGFERNRLCQAASVSRFLLPVNSNGYQKRKNWIFVRGHDTIRSCDRALGLMRDGDLCLSLGSDAETVNLPRAAGIRFLGGRCTLESDCL
jgi:hypothetical protein